MEDQYPGQRVDLADRSIKAWTHMDSPTNAVSPRELEDTSSMTIPTMSPHAAAHFLAREFPIPLGDTAFHRFPPAVIQRILWAADANSFASLCMLNRNWYAASQDCELYAYHLSRCPSFALSNSVVTGPFRRNDLYRLKNKFAAEVRRNLFDAYLQPRQTLVNLISATASSSAAFPGGEAFRFAYSPNGQTVLALSSSRIYVLDIASDPIRVLKELKTVRKPLAASITDDGTLLAVLSSKHQANIYGLSSEKVTHLQVLVLDNPPRTIALTHEGTVLAAAYENGVEVFSLATNALSTDRRAVRSEPVDTLMFSGDGSMLVGSSQNLEEPNAVVITAPFYTENDPDVSARSIHSRMWTTQILFPQISSIASHAELLQGHSEADASWLFAYDHSLMSYRAVRTDDTRTGVAYFLNPPAARRFSMPTPSIPPTATACGTLVAAGFGGVGLSIYGVPERLDISPDMGAVVERHEKELRGPIALTSATGSMEPLMAYSPSASGDSYDIEDDSIASKVDWRQSIFVKCRQINTIDGFKSAKWVEHLNTRRGSFPDKRLVIVAPGGVHNMDEDMGEESVPVDGSRICLLDFNYSPSTPANREITLRVGERQPELLTEQSGNMDVEVAMERRRTVRNAYRGVQSTALHRSVTSALPLSPSTFDQQFLLPSPTSPLTPFHGGVQNSLNDPNLSILAKTGSPHSLHRANTAASYSNARYPPRPPLHVGSSPNWAQPVPDGWESPPPPYPHRLQNPTPPPPAVTSRFGEPLQSTQNRVPPQPLDTQMASHITITMPVQDSPNPTMSPAPMPLRHHFTEPVQPTQVVVQGPPRAGTLPVATMTIESTPTQVIDNTRSSLPQQRHSVALQGHSLDAADTRPTGPGTNSIGTTQLQQSRSSYGNPNSQMLSSLDSSHVSHPQNLNNPRMNVSPITSVTGGDRQLPAQYQGQPSSAPHTNSPTRLTLTGANLRNRLNHPVPPTPDSFVSYDAASSGGQRWQADQPQQRNDQTYSNGQVHMRVQATMTPQTQTAQPSFELLPPTSDQVANLSRRLSQTRPRPLSVVTQGNYGIQTGTAPQDLGRVPPSPPRAAWGASGVPGAVSFNKAINSPNGLNRSGSRASNQSLGGSTSTPNLHYPQRPPYGRLDTIESIGSAGGVSEPTTLQRPRSMVPDMSAYAATSAARYYVGMEGSNTGQASLPTAKDKRPRGKRNKAASLPNVHEYGQTTQQPPPKKSSRCTVM